VQVSSVGLQSLYAIRPYVDREALPENPENPASSITDQEKPVDLRDLLSSNVTLDQLLAKDTSVTKVPEDDGDIHALSEEALRKSRINRFALHMFIYELDRRYTAWHRAVESGQQYLMPHSNNKKIVLIFSSMISGAR